MPTYQVEVQGWALVSVDAADPAGAERAAKRLFLTMPGGIEVKAPRWSRFHPQADTVHAIPHEEDGPFCRGCDKPHDGKGDICSDCLYGRADHLRDVQRNAEYGL